MLSSAITGVRSWAMPTSTQDLAFPLDSESTTQDVAQRPGPASSSTICRPLDASTPTQEANLPGRLTDQVMTRKTKTTTTYVLAYPPPNTRSGWRLSIRPRMILQFQHVSKTIRSLPVFDVVSATVFASRFTRSVPGIAKAGKRSGMNDLLLVRSDTYERDRARNENVNDDWGDESARHRDFLGRVCYAKHGRDGSTNRDHICLANGLVWEASCLKAGIYEFSGKNHDGPKLRWVLREVFHPDRGKPALSNRHRQSLSSRFTFSIINPGNRRHPVIAALTRDNKLDILDRFTASPSPVTASPSSSTLQSPQLSEFSSETLSHNDSVGAGFSYIETDESLRVLIMLTGIWVMSEEGWSDVLPKYSGMMKRSREDQISKPASSTVSSTKSIPKGALQETSGTSGSHDLRPVSTSPLRHWIGYLDSRSPGATSSRRFNHKRDSDCGSERLDDTATMSTSASSCDQEGAGLSDCMNETSEIDEGRQQQRKWEKIRAVCKSLAGPGVRHA